MNRENQGFTDDAVVTLLPGGKQFSTHRQATLLESGLSAGVALPYRCNNGTCGDCRARLVSGKVEKTRFHDYVLSTTDKADNVMLLCCHRALTDVHIEISEANNPEDIPHQQLNTRLCYTETDTDTLIVRLKIVRGKALWYLAGQYATLHLPGHPPRLLPVASCPCEAGTLEFHLPLEHTEVTRAIKQQSRRERIRVDGPTGNFTVNDRDLNTHHHVFIAAGQRFAAIKPMIEHIIATEIEPRCTLIRVSATPYKHNLCRSWADAFDWLNYHTVADASSLPAVFPTPGKDPLNDHVREQPMKVYLSAPPGQGTPLQAWLKNIDSATVVIDQTADAWNG